ncbi:MAG: lysostaphin resistance A-like protein [Planctomycetota bacterium]|jgi:membrane protease YdiL (CAAX protease family)
MTEAPPPAEDALGPHTPREACGYCGAVLDPFFYFCTSCATPYKHEEAVLPNVPRLQLTHGQRIAKKAPAVARLFWTYFAVLVGSAVVTLLFVGPEFPTIAVFVMDGAIFVTTAFFAVSYWRSLVPQFKRIGFDHWEAWVGVLALAPLLLLNYGYHHWLSDMMGAPDESFIEDLREAGLSQAALVLTICIFPAVTEEIAFRGLVQHWLRIAVPIRTAIVLSSALFMAMHLSLLSAPYLFAVGCLLGWVKWRTESLYPVMVIHFLHNLAVLEVFPS